MEKWFFSLRWEKSTEKRQIYAVAGEEIQSNGLNFSKVIVREVIC
jgi:hypothetical protein